MQPTKTALKRFADVAEIIGSLPNGPWEATPATLRPLLERAWDAGKAARLPAKKVFSTKMFQHVQRWYERKKGIMGYIPDSEQIAGKAQVMFNLQQDEAEDFALVFLTGRHVDGRQSTVWEGI